MHPVRIPTHRYIKEFIEKEVPNRQITGNTLVCQFLLHSLSKRSNHQRSKYSNAYKDNVVLYLSPSQWLKYGNIINETQVMKFNLFMSRLIRERLVTSIITYMSFDLNLSRAILHARVLHGVEDESRTDDAIIKDYQRYRDRKGAPRVYQLTKSRKKSAESVQFDKPLIAAI